MKGEKDLKWYLKWIWNILLFIGLIITIGVGGPVFIDNTRQWIKGEIVQEQELIMSIFVFFLYTFLIILFTYLLARKKNLSEKIQSIKEPKEDFIKDKLPILQDRIKRTLIPQLRDKVIERSKSSEFSNREDFFRIWLDGNEEQFSTARILVYNLESDKIFDGDSYHIRNKFKKADKELFLKVDDLYNKLKIYDALMTTLLERIKKAYSERFESGWGELAELHFYELFKVKEHKRRKGYCRDKKRLSKGKTLTSDLKTAKKGIDKSADVLIEKCNEIVNWKKKKKKI